MNIRNFSNPLTSVDAINKTAEKKEVKMSNSSEDRDADGRQYEAEQDKSPLNEDEMTQAKEYFQNLESLKKAGLDFSVEESEEMRVFLIKSPDGQVVRRIPEYEMRELIRAKSLNKGQIFSRAG